MRMDNISVSKAVVSIAEIITELYNRLQGFLDGMFSDFLLIFFPFPCNATVHVPPEAARPLL